MLTLSLLYLIEYCTNLPGVDINGFYNVAGVCNQYLSCTKLFLSYTPLFSAIRRTCAPGTAFNGLRSSAQPCVPSSSCNVVFGKWQLLYDSKPHVVCPVYNVRTSNI